MRSWFLLAIAPATWLLLASLASAGELPDFQNIQIEGLTHTAVGVTRGDTPIDAYVSADDVDYSSKKCRILLIGGLDGDRKSVDAVLDVLKWFQTHEDAKDYHSQLALSAIPCANPDGVLLDKGEENGRGGKPGEGYPPTGKYYHSPTNVESQYLWRWIGMHTPDVVIDVRAGKETSWGVPRDRELPWTNRLASEHRLQPQVDISGESNSLITTLAVDPQATSRRTPALRATLGDRSVLDMLSPFLSRQSTGMLKPTFEGQRTPLKDADPVSSSIKSKFLLSPPGASYFDTLPIVARNRQGGRQGANKLSTDFAHLDDWMLEVDAPKVKSGGELAGRYMFVALARDPRGKHADAFRKKLREAADLAFDAQGAPLAEPYLHTQMSDAVFMNGPILAGAGAITGERKYFDACAQHVNFILKLCKRDDGLYRHSPLCEAAWGRGNGFVAMGLALVLEDFDQKHPAYPELLKAYQEDMAALKKHQDYTGCWHQVIDHPESYREFSCTCMIGFAMATGIRHGWLDKETYQPCVDKAWGAAQIRSIGDNFSDVCTGTGKQKTLRDYLDREALSGFDPRAVSMYLMFASER